MCGAALRCTTLYHACLYCALHPGTARLPLRRPVERLCFAYRCSLISSDESEEGYRYEALRLQKLFSLSAREWGTRAEDAAVPFYQKTLALAIDGKGFTAAKLAAVRRLYKV